MTRIPATTAALVAIGLSLSACNFSVSSSADAETGEDSAAPANAPVTDADKAAAETAIRAIYATYNREDTSAVPSAEDRPVFSQELTALIATIPHHEGELGLLDDADWFCGCQDWDGATAGITQIASESRPDGKVEVTSHFLPVADAEPTVITFLMVKEAGQWKIDDMIRPSGNSTLRRDIAAAVSEASGG